MSFTITDAPVDTCWLRIKFFCSEFDEGSFDVWWTISLQVIKTFLEVQCVTFQNICQCSRKKNAWHPHRLQAREEFENHRQEVILNCARCRDVKTFWAQARGQRPLPSRTKSNLRETTSPTGEKTTESMKRHNNSLPQIKNVVHKIPQSRHTSRSTRQAFQTPEPVQHVAQLPAQVPKLCGRIAHLLPKTGDLHESITEACVELLAFVILLHRSPWAWLLPVAVKTTTPHPKRTHHSNRPQNNMTRAPRTQV